MNLKKAYHYLYYRLYRYYNSGFFVFKTEMKANIALSILELLFLISIYVYYKIFINRYIHLNNNLYIWIITVLVYAFNYIVFQSRDQWKTIIKEFDNLSRKKRIIYDIAVYIFIAFVFANLIFSFYLMSQIDWSLYR